VKPYTVATHDGLSAILVLTLLQLSMHSGWRCGVHVHILQGKFGSPLPPTSTITKVKTAIHSRVRRGGEGNHERFYEWLPVSMPQVIETLWRWCI